MRFARLVTLFAGALTALGFQAPAGATLGTVAGRVVEVPAWERKTFTLVASDVLIAEFRDVVARPFFRARLRASAAELLAVGLRDFSIYFCDLPSGPIAPDPKDSYLLAMAEAGHADFLVTGDRELLSLKHHKSTRIVTPAAMIEALKSQGNR